MNRELKVPAALAIMLVGFGAMLFWCGKPQGDAGTEAALEDFSDIDDEIRDRPHTPHLTGLESSSEALAQGLNADPTAGGSRSNDNGWLSWLHGSDSGDTALVSDGKHSATAGVGETGPQAQSDRKYITSRPVDGNISLGPAAGDLDVGDEHGHSPTPNSGIARDATGRPNGVPAPIQSVAPPATGVDTGRRENEGWDVVPPGDSEGVSKQTVRPSVARRRTYVIQPGDTLSRIAAKFLDGSHRAQEIFEANRDVLTDPNQLNVGTEIVIPDRDVPPAETDVEPNGPVAGTPESSRAERTGGRGSLFVPVSNSPLNSSVNKASSHSVTKPAAKSTPREYTVRRGDSLERIAVAIYGTRTKALDIFRANAERLTSPNAIREGMVLVLP